LCDVAVCPGDIVVGDADGVVIVPLAKAEWVLERLRRVQAAEEKTIAMVRQGATMSASAARLVENAVIIESR
jgi:4-hydroxy-4-methyl-2-oxoglutarate aldolase